MYGEVFVDFLIFWFRVSLGREVFLNINVVVSGEFFFVFCILME